MALLNLEYDFPIFIRQRLILNFISFLLSRFTQYNLENLVLV
jgi:hypothetical protein